MTLVNLDNFVLIGPGSEWFWSAVSGIVLAVTVVALYRQLRLQRSADAVAQVSAFSREFFGEDLTRSRSTSRLGRTSRTTRSTEP